MIMMMMMIQRDHHLYSGFKLSYDIKIIKTTLLYSDCLNRIMSRKRRILLISSFRTLWNKLVIYSCFLSIALYFYWQDACNPLKYCLRHYDSLDFKQVLKGMWKYKLTDRAIEIIKWTEIIEFKFQKRNSNKL